MKKIQEGRLLTAIDAPLFHEVARVASETAMTVYVVGGFVRDYLLDRPFKKDIDFVVMGDALYFAEMLARQVPNHPPKVKLFKRYGTAMLRYRGCWLEFVGARKESYNAESRNPNVASGTLEDDQNRRDFTINALAISLNKSNYGFLLDSFGGVAHLESRLIKTPLAPDSTFSDDPLRMMRAIRFASELNFDIDSTTLRGIVNNHQRIQIVSKERIMVEFNKILASKKPSRGLRLLEQTGLLKNFLPELVALKGVDEIDGQKHKDNFYHTLQVVDNIAKVTDDLWLRWAALLHDVGKAPTKKFVPAHGWTFHAHEFVGAKMTYHIFKRLKMPLGNDMKFVQKMVLLSSRPIILATEVTDAAVRRLVFDAGADIDALMLLCEADITTKNKHRFQVYRNNFKKVRQKIEEVEARDKVRNFQPPISGDLIMRTFSLKPCPDIGIIKNQIKEAILEGEIPNEYDAAYRLMLNIGKKRGFLVKDS